MPLLCQVGLSANDSMHGGSPAAFKMAQRESDYQKQPGFTTLNRGLGTRPTHRLRGGMATPFFLRRIIRTGLFAIASRVRRDE